MANISKEKIPDRLVDSCKHSSINQTAADSKLTGCSHGIFLLSTTFSNTPYLRVTPCSRIGCRARSPTDLHHWCYK